MFSAFLPKSAPFFKLMKEQNLIARKMSKCLVNAMEDMQKVVDCAKEIALLEDEGDSIHSKIIWELSKSFITPIDREDILRINQYHELIMDCFQSISARLGIFEFSSTRFPASKISHLILEMLNLTELMLDGLEKRYDCHKTKEFHALNEECDSVLTAGLAELMAPSEFGQPTDILLILKWSQVYDRFDMLVEQVNTLAEIIEEAVLKNA